MIIKPYLLRYTLCFLQVNCQNIVVLLRMFRSFPSSGPGVRKGLSLRSLSGTLSRSYESPHTQSRTPTCSLALV